MTATKTAEPASRESAFQPWMFANVAVGAGFTAFVALLVPPYITQATGSPSEAGVIMALMSLAAVAGPVFGGIADRYNAHRYVMVGGMVAMTLALVAFGVASGDSEFQVIDAVIMGLGVAGVSAVAPVFIVSAGLSEALQARRLTAFSIAFPAGQVAGGMMLSVAAQAEWSFSARFYLGAVVLGLCTVIVWFTSAAPTAAIVHDDDPSDQEDSDVEETRRTGFSGVIFSMFGLYLLVLVLSSTANNGINSQIANILPNLYGISETATSSLISLAGLLNIVLFFAAGKAMKGYGPLAPFLAGTVMRFGGALGMALLGLVTKAPVLLVAAAMQLLYQGSPFARLPQNVLAVRFAPIPSGQANGWVIAGSAMGSFIGSLLGGWLADEVGYNAINWMGAVAAGLGVALLVIVIWPMNKSRYGDEDGETGQDDDPERDPDSDSIDERSG
jgi:predicted MFS family arabinose efflux permease